MIKALDKCPVCGSEWVGGNSLPGQLWKEKSRNFYECGANISYEIIGPGDGARILITGCSALLLCHG